MLNSAASLLVDLPEKPEVTVSLRQAIEILQNDLRSSLDKGYHYEELTDILGEHEISISPSTLKRYLALSQGGTSQRRRSRAVPPEEDSSDQKSIPRGTTKRRARMK